MYGDSGAMDPSMPQGGGYAMDPSAGYAMDPSMPRGGGYGMDPSMPQGGGYAMDPSMTQGGGYAMDPSMPQGGGYAMQGNMDPMAYGTGQGVMMEPMLQQSMGQAPNMAADPAAFAEQRARAVEEVRLKKQKEDTYKVRRLEGRPKHGYSSVGAVALSSFAAVLQITALGTPAWRSSWTGVFGYPAARGWGLFAVQGRQKKMWHEIASQTCSIYGQLNVGGMCVTPACLWYKLKCTTYIQFFVAGYAVGTVLLISLLLHLLGISWLARLTPRTIKYASIWWPIGVALNLGLPIAWYIYTETLFDNLAEQSYYPAPSVGPSTFASGVAQAFLIICAWLSCNLKRWWPEPDVKSFGEDSDEDDEDDGGDDDDPKDGSKEKGNAASAPEATSTLQAPGMHPQEGGGGGAADWQQPSYAMPPQEDYYAYPQPGYDVASMQPAAEAWGTPPSTGQPPLPPQ